MRFDLITDSPERLLAAVMEHFEGSDSIISFEGDLKDSEITSLEGLQPTETRVLRRSTLSPHLDFYIAPLSRANVQVINRAVATEHLLGEEGELIHIQVARGNVLVFGAYDNFHEESVFVEGMPASLLTQLERDHILAGFAPDDA
jgi:hypothetical protein